MGLREFVCGMVLTIILAIQSLKFSNSNTQGNNNGCRFRFSLLSKSVNFIAPCVDIFDLHLRQNKLTRRESISDTYNIVVEHRGDVTYREGQSFGVIPPGVNAKGKTYSNRLYSVASDRLGDDRKVLGVSVTFCVRRSLFLDPVSGEPDLAKKGVCSNFLCDTKPGDEIRLTGPTGKALLLPDNAPHTDIIMVATGTGVAPFRSFVHRLFATGTSGAAQPFSGLAWLFLGVTDSQSVLYDALWDDLRRNHSTERFRVELALSREQRNESGGKMYVQDRLQEHFPELLSRMDKGAHIYFCGNKGMMRGVLAAMERSCSERGLVWVDTLRRWRAAGQWHVEVY